MLQLNIIEFINSLYAQPSLVNFQSESAELFDVDLAVQKLRRNHHDTDTIAESADTPSAESIALHVK